MFKKNQEMEEYKTALNSRWLIKNIGRIAL